MNAPKFKVGDRVTFINDYRVAFLNRTIVGIDETDPDVRYFMTPNEAHWYSSPERNFIFADEPLPDDIVVYSGECVECSRYDWQHADTAIDHPFTPPKRKVLTSQV